MQTPPPLLPSPSSLGTKKPTSQDGGHPSSTAGTACWTGSFLQRLCLVGKDPSSSPLAWALTGGLLSPPWFPPPSPCTWFQNLGHKSAGTDGCRLEGQAAPQGGHSDFKKKKKGRPCACSWCGSPMRTAKTQDLLQREDLRFQGGCSDYPGLQTYCAAYQCLSPRQGSGLLQNGNVSGRPDRCPASLGLDASSDITS